MSTVYQDDPSHKHHSQFWYACFHQCPLQCCNIQMQSQCHRLNIQRKPQIYKIVQIQHLQILICSRWWIYLTMAEETNDHATIIAKWSDLTKCSVWMEVTDMSARVKPKPSVFPPTCYDGLKCWLILNCSIKALNSAAFASGDRWSKIWGNNVCIVQTQ